MSSPRPEHRRRGPRRFDDAGAVLPELALVAPLLVLLVLGIIEFGFAWRTKTTVSSGVQLAARTASNSSPDRLSDLNAMLALRASLGDRSEFEFDYAIIYRGQTGTNSSPPPANCLSTANALSPTSPAAAGVNNTCNIYTRAALATRLSIGPSYHNGSPTCDGNDYDRFWCPTVRDDSTLTPSVVGIYVKGRYKSFTSILPGDGITITDYSTMRVEPNLNL